MAELFRRGGRMSSNGLKLQQPIDATRLTPEELKKREETWLPSHGICVFFVFVFFGLGCPLFKPSMGYVLPLLWLLCFFLASSLAKQEKRVWWLRFGFLP